MTSRGGLGVGWAGRPGGKQQPKESAEQEPRLRGLRTHRLSRKPRRKGCLSGSGQRFCTWWGSGHMQRGSHPALHTGCFKLKIRAPVGCSHDRTLITLGSYRGKGPQTQSVQTGKLKSPERKGDPQSFLLLPRRWGNSQPSGAGAEKL